MIPRAIKACVYGFDLFYNLSKKSPTFCSGSFGVSIWGFSNLICQLLISNLYVTVYGTRGLKPPG